MKLPAGIRDLSHRLDRANAGICEPGDVWYWDEFKSSLLYWILT